MEYMRRETDMNRINGMNGMNGGFNGFNGNMGDDMNEMEPSKKKLNGQSKIAKKRSLN